MLPLVSVVIPTYNRARYLTETIESVLDQTHRSLDVIVVDDESTDDTRDIVARYAPDVRYVWQKNAERGAARNRGLRLARGEFISFLDSDDVWMSDKLERDLELFSRRPEVGLVYADIELIDAAGRSLGVRRRSHHEGWVTGALLKGNFIINSAHLARCAAIREVKGFREERVLSGSEDWELWVRLSTHWQFAHVAAATTKYRVHADNSMSSAEGMERSLRYASKLMESADLLAPGDRSLMPYANAYVALVCAINYCSADDHARSWARLLEALRHAPRVALDPRFAYTVGRLLFREKVPAAIRLLRERACGTAATGGVVGKVAGSAQRQRDP